MKVQTKNILLATLLFASLISCKSKISEEVIESYKTENSFYEKTLIEKSVSKEDLLQETEDNYKQFISEIDPAKKTAFEKDTTLIRSLFIETVEENTTYTKRPDSMVMLAEDVVVPVEAAVAVEKVAEVVPEVVVETPAPKVE